MQKGANLNHANFFGYLDETQYAEKNHKHMISSEWLCPVSSPISGYVYILKKKQVHSFIHHQKKDNVEC